MATMMQLECLLMRYIKQQKIAFLESIRTLATTNQQVKKLMRFIGQACWMLTINGYREEAEPVGLENQP